MKIISQKVKWCECTLADGTKIYIQPFIRKVRKLRSAPYYAIEVGTIAKTVKKV